MALQEALGASSGELMREDAITGGRMTRIFATVWVVGGVLLSRPFCWIHYGPRITGPRVFRWHICGAVCAAAAMPRLLGCGNRHLSLKHSSI
ncbi:hypothetical protein CY35_17G051300 [Sphagnum magellanicum]|nr:hypothetical protein CY35_17G051300 [Sphagnum magellanicum]